MIEYSMNRVTHAVTANRLLNAGRTLLPPKFGSFNSFGVIKSVTRYE